MAGRALTPLVLLGALPGCGGGSDAAPRAQHRDGRAQLAASGFAPLPPVDLDAEIPSPGATSSSPSGR